VIKAISWRVLGTLATSALVFIFTRRWALSLAVGAFEFVSKIGLFWVHERVWDRLHFGREEIKPLVLWFTGLSGSGKSTISRWVADRLRAQGYRVEQLDGDTVRHIFPNTGFTRPERHEHLKRVGYLAGKLEKNGVFVVASFVSPYEESRQTVRAMCENFVEIFVDTPLEICEQRDVKGLYGKARRGEIRNFTGIDDPYERPTSPELVLTTTEQSVEDAGRKVLELVSRRTRQGIVN